MDLHIPNKSLLGTSIGVHRSPPTITATSIAATSSAATLAAAVAASTIAWSGCDVGRAATHRLHPGAKLIAPCGGHHYADTCVPFWDSRRRMCTYNSAVVMGAAAGDGEMVQNAAL